MSYNKFLAKLASDQRKPDGLFVITPTMGPGFVEALPVGRFHGVGPATAAKMQRLGIRTGADLRAASLDTLQRHFGKAGAYFHAIARGVDERPVRPDRARKSIGAETTFPADLHEIGPMGEALRPLVDKVWRHCEATGTRGRTVTLKVKFADFTLITRSRSLDRAADGPTAIERAGLELLAALQPVPKGVRLLGVTLSALGGDDAAEPAQMSLAFATP